MPTSPPPPLIIAHRGATSRAPENSLAALRAAGPAGADGVELDVRVTVDGHFVVVHDERLGGRHVAELTLDEARYHRLSNGEHVPTLEEALACLPPTLSAFVEVKALPPELDHALLAVLDRGPGPDRYQVHSFDHRIIRRLGERRSGLSRGILSTAYPVRPLAALQDAGATALWQERALVDAPLVRVVHEANAALYVWTVNDPAEMAVLARLGVDGICTDRPDLTRRVVQELDPA